jgi:D-beta-D-heptose 7-phosphate kinase/D-beta-D-heptose 1-phosphate adenosyltransferase
MTLPLLDAGRARELVGRFSGLRVLVVGDVMLDRFVVGRVTRISPEAPVPIVRFESEHVRLGGAANVAHNLAALGGRASLVGIVGVDAAADSLRAQLAAAGIGTDGLVADGARPTTEKVRVVTERNQQVARIDYERDADAGGEVERAIVAQVHRLGDGAKALLVSDYLKGAITRTVVESLLQCLSAEASGGAGPADRRSEDRTSPATPAPRWYAEPSRSGSRHAPPHPERRRRASGGAHFRNARAVRRGAITRGEHGMWLSESGTEGSIPAVTREVSDVTGAGDTVVATLSSSRSPRADDGGGGGARQPRRRHRRRQIRPGDAHRCGTVVILLRRRSETVSAGNGACR